MDGYVLAECSASGQQTYSSQVLKLFVSDRIALGSVAILEAQIFLLRFLAAVYMTRLLHNAMEGFGEVEDGK